VYTLPRGVEVGCLRVLMEWVEWMWRVALFLLTVGTTRQANRDGYEVEQRWRAGGGSEVWLYARML